MNDQTMTFDADAFMNTQVDAPMATQLQGVPEGEYVAMVGDFDSTAFKTVDTKNGQRAVLDIPFVIQDEALKQRLNRDTIIHRETYWLDMTPQGQLDTGPDKNVNLGRLRDALGQNGSGPWSPAMLRNMGPVRIAIKTRSDKNDPEKKYTGISKYAKIS